MRDVSKRVHPESVVDFWRTKLYHNIVFLLLLVIVSSCDYGGEYYYYIENGLKSDTITVKTHIRRQNEKIMDNVFELFPKERRLIRVTYSGNLSKSEHPSDDQVFLYSDLGEFEVFIKTQKIEKNLWERDYWEYKSEVHKGTYLLVIGERIVREE